MQLDLFARKYTWLESCDPDIVAGIEEDMIPFDAYRDEQIALAIETHDYLIATNALRWVYLCEETRKELYRCRHTDISESRPIIRQSKIKDSK